MAAVGEVYGAGISLTYAASHHLPVNATTILFCDYPITDVKETTRGKRRSVSFRIAGDKKGRCSLRLLPRGAEPMSSDTRLRKSTRAGWVEQDSERSDEGHRLFSARDQDRFVLSIKG